MRRYRYLFAQLVRRELRQKYKGSALGVLWYLVNPLVLMVVYGVMLGPLLKAVTLHRTTRSSSSPGWSCGCSSPSRCLRQRPR